jgi:type II secretory pathway pseudopilin PulG
MKSGTNFNSPMARTSITPMRRVPACSGFTLAEVLAALLFMAIVIPVAVEGLHIASQAGEVAERKNEAARVAERILNESIAMTNTVQSSQSGTVVEGHREFRWTLQNETWSQTTTNPATALSSASSGQLASGQPMVNQSAANQIAMNLLSVEVSYAVQNRDYSVRLSTLVSAQ